MNDLELLKTLVEFESPSDDKAACDALAAHLRQRLTDIGADIEIHRGTTRGDHIEARVDGAGNDPPALILCHYDTVWPLGTTTERPFRIESGRAFGPGVYDMKASLVMAESIIRHARETTLHPPIVVLLTSDEEVGSPTSRALVERRASEAAFVLVLEPPLAPGVLKLRRKGTGTFRLEVEGRSAHAGLEPENGINALVELAHQVLRLTALSDLAKGTTVSVGVARGGSVANVIPASAEAHIDVRAWTVAEGERVRQAILSAEPVLPGAAVRATGELNRPPMELSTEQEALFEKARSIASSLNVDLKHGAVGGGSDGNLTAALGVPTLDGLGCSGGGAHSQHEYVVIDSIGPQTELVLALITEL